MFEQFFELFTGFRVFQTVSHGCFKVTQFAAAIVAFAIKRMSQHKLVVEQAGDTVCQLNFVTGAAGQVGQQVKNTRSQDVAADNSKVGRRFFRFGFFNVDSFSAVQLRQYHKSLFEKDQRFQHLKCCYRFGYTH